MIDNKKSDLDDFWDLSKLIPEKKRSKSVGSHIYDTTPVEVILKAKETTSDDRLKTIEMRPAVTNENKLSFVRETKEPPKPSLEYSPENPFIKSVKIYNNENFSYYAAFYEEGLKLLDRVGEGCNEPSFFSYVPQYSQLNEGQLNFYFYMRQNLREKKVISAAYSYILLYLFELINVEPDKKHALDQLCFVWNGYRKRYARLDGLLKEWIADFCLIHCLSPNEEALGDAYKTAAQNATLKELFVCCGKNEKELYDGYELVNALLSLCSNYNWRNSRYATEENIPLYATHIPEALRHVLSAMRGKNNIFVGERELKRDAFSGALCTPDNKRRIEVTYCSVDRSYEMRFLVGDVVKYTENRIRTYLGIKSKLTVYSLPTDVRNTIDLYMDNAVGTKRKPKPEVEKNEYDGLYEAPKREFSLDVAKKIEETSWETTQLLVDAFDDESSIEPLPEEKIAVAIPQKEDVSDEEALLCALAPYMDFIETALSGDGSKQVSVASEMGRIPDSLADEINEVAANVFGDIILEKNGDIYSIIEDYTEVFK